MGKHHQLPERMDILQRLEAYPVDTEQEELPGLIANKGQLEERSINQVATEAYLACSAGVAILAEGGQLSWQIPNYRSPCFTSTSNQATSTSGYIAYFTSRPTSTSDSIAYFTSTSGSIAYFTSRPEVLPTTLLEHLHRFLISHFQVRLVRDHHYPYPAPSYSSICMQPKCNSN